MKNSFCPACGSEKIEGIKRIKLPIILFPIEIEKHLEVPHHEIDVLHCRQCNHVFLEKIDEEMNRKIYSDYYYLYPFSNLESMNTHYRIPFENFFKCVMDSIRGDALLEIGCSTSSQMDFFKGYGFSCTGISPGAELSDSFEMVDGYYEEHLFYRKFDVIVSRFNVEHIANLEIFFNKINKDLVDKGKIFIQVPNVEYFLDSGILNVFAHEHAHYFCPHSLVALLERMNYSVEACYFSQAPSLIVMAGKKEKRYDPSKIVVANSKKIDQIKELILAHEGRVIFYGAGLSLTAILYEIDFSLFGGREFLIFDDNPMLDKLVMPGNPIRVTNYDPLEITKNTLLFLTLAPMYHEKIIDKIGESRCGCRVIAVNADGLVQLV